MSGVQAQSENDNTPAEDMSEAEVRALREAREESGLTRLRAVGLEVFDCDRHLIPARGTEPEHYHHDLRFMIEADPTEPLVISNESKDLAWIEVARVTSLNPEESMARMVRKTIVGAETRVSP